MFLDYILLSETAGILEKQNFCTKTKTNICYAHLFKTLK